jgi:2EXR family
MSTESQWHAVASHVRFPLFSSLPLELRLYIWRHSLKERVISVERSIQGKEVDEIDITEGWKILAPHIPALLHVNRESRSCGLEFYRLLPKSIMPNLYIHDTLDTVFLRTPSNDISDAFWQEDERETDIDGRHIQVNGENVQIGGWMYVAASYLWTGDRRITSLALDYDHLFFGLSRIGIYIEEPQECADRWVGILSKTTSLQRLTFIYDGMEKLVDQQVRAWVPPGTRQGIERLVANSLKDHGVEMFVVQTLTTEMLCKSA